MSGSEDSEFVECVTQDCLWTDPAGTPHYHQPDDSPPYKLAIKLPKTSQ